MKDKSLKVNYFRMENGGIQVFIGKDNKMLVDFILFPDGNMWLELGDKNKGHLTVYPDNALHREWYKEVCSACGWESEPHEGVPFGPGGTLSCPACEKAKRNGPGIESSYGNVDAVQLDWETKKPLCSSLSEKGTEQK